MSPTKIAAVLADAANLPLGSERAAVAGELLATWLPAANELSRKMSAVEHTSLVPATVFRHRSPDTEA